MDEIGLFDGEEEMGDTLLDFAEDFYDRVIQGVCSVIESFIEDIEDEKE